MTRMNSKGKIIATDLDGTLFFPKKRFRMLTNRNKVFIRKFIDDGGKLVIVSGRNCYFTNKVIKKINRKADVIGCNSSFVIVDNKTIQETPINNEKICVALEEIKKRFHPTGIFLMSKDYNMIIPNKEFYIVHRIGFIVYSIFQGTYREPFVKSDELLHKELKNGVLYKIMLFFGVTKKAKQRSMEANREMSKLFPDFEFSWCGELIEINAKGVNKASGIKTYLDYLKIKNDNIMVVGDSGNDISMFRSYENSFCMSHAPLHVSKYANHVINSVNDLEKYMIDKSEEDIYE